MSNSSLAGRTVIIAGATGSLGSVVTALFAEAGAKLALLGRDQAKLDELAAERKLPSSRSLTKAVDLSKPQEAGDAARAS
ncbi:MAG: SDR family NAD(P)-dependent oxidoreductase [Chloroflexi bacterium]|nr:SDR family NAD(P)-dependent oxidoreductase [Chloroflexota bacterium]